MNKKILILFSALILGIGGFTYYLGARNKQHLDHRPKKSSTEKKQMYHCPMHPTYTSDKPGDCPICQMKLVPIEEEEHEESIQNSEQQTLSKKDDDQITEQDHALHEKDKPPTTSEKSMYEKKANAPENRSQKKAVGPSGQATIKISSEREQLIGVKSSVVNIRELKIEIRAQGQVAYDVELYNAISEYKTAQSAKEKAKQSPWPDVQERAESLVNASILRLRQLGLSQEEIKRIENKDNTNLILPEKNGPVWVYAQIYEYESALAKVGQSIEIKAKSLPGKKFSGKIRAIDPILNKETRTLRIRAEVLNPENLLKPEMFVEVKIQVPLGNKLALPEEAVLHTGERNLVFVSLGQGKYEPREVVLGQEAEGYYELISGVSKGEKVVTSANFLIDSESKLKAAVSGMGHQH
ncbi:MAG: efflux RND transporter periplasmic adaptor subunit [Elusimicrobia bacterium]|nr:efflux RND transporter periplasmic adaptor subunit [Elusimicrobiota bacterium]